MVFSIHVQNELYGKELHEHSSNSLLLSQKKKITAYRFSLLGELSLYVSLATREAVIKGCYVQVNNVSETV